MTDFDLSGHLPGHRLDFRLLGPLHGRLDGRELDLGPPQQRALLAVLLLRPGRPVGSDELAEAIWGEDPPQRALGMLRQYAWRLRTVLEPDRPARGAGTVLVSVADGYALRIEPPQVDAHRFEEDLATAARAAADGDREATRTRLAAALAHWTGTPLAGLPGPYAERQRDRLTELRLGAQEDLLDCLLETGRSTEALAELQTLTALHPLRERPRAQLMLALYRSGRQAEALGVYAETRRLLTAELGVEPGAALSDLQARILAADPGLDVPSPTVPVPARPADRTPRQLTADVADFTGRADTVEQLAAGLRPGPGGALAVCTVSGPGGVGKTALAVHVAHRVRAEFPDGQLYVDLRGAGPAPAEPGTVLARFLQTLGLPESAVPEDLEQRAAHYRSLLAERRALVVLDNAHDTAQIRPLLPGGGGCAVLVTSRARTILLPGARQFELDVLTEDEALALLTAVIGPQRVAAEPAAARELVAVCGRLPLAVRIVARRLAGRPGRPLADLLARLRDQHRRLDELRVGDLAVEATLHLGYSALRPEPARAFRLLAFGDLPDLPVDVAAALLGTDRDGAEHLAETLVDAGLLDPYRADSYRYHDLLRLYAQRLRERTDPVADQQDAVRRLLDHLLASTANVSHLIEPGHALHRSLHPTEAPGSTPADESAARQWLRDRHTLLAATVEHALRELPGAARPAVDLLLLWFGLAEGPAHRGEFQRLISLATDTAREQHSPGAEARARYLSGVLHYLTNAYAPAEQQLTRSLALAEQADDHVARHLAANALGVLHFSTARPERALELLLLAKELAELFGDRGSAGLVLSTISRVYVALGSPEQAVAAAEGAVQAARAVANSSGVARVLYQYGCVLRRTGQPEPATTQLTEALDHFRSHRHRDWEGLTLARLAECHLDRAHRPEATHLAEQALTIATELTKPYAQALAHTVLGQSLPSATHLRTALTLFDQLGSPEAAAVRTLLADQAEAAPADRPSDASTRTGMS
ncbi:BTAD domain-containing putative transcriptional regulator [Kitasatospora sp. NPDC051853]|uniref:AfsR/SARP family transcriptional regulator n=1 Tax=Kitasatospora sp. NPDC051853 TaxID=3364058 RepID=UPI0037BAED9F